MSKPMDPRGSQQTNAKRSAEDRTRSVFLRSVGATCLLMLTTALPSHAVTLEVTDLATDGGIVSGDQLFVPPGGTVTIGSRVVSDPTPVVGLGLSYYGYDETLITATNVVRQTNLFGPLCLEGIGEISGLSVLPGVPGGGVVSPAHFGPLEGRERVRVYGGFTFSPATYSAANSAGIDGVCGGGDADFRVTFDALAEGTTSITIGTGDDKGGIVILQDGTTIQATNATVQVTVPEPAFASGVLLGTAILGFLRRSNRP